MDALIGDYNPYSILIGHMFTFDGDNISWRCMLQNGIAQYTIEVDNIITAKVTKEAICLNRLITNIWLKHEVVNLHYDNQSASRLVANQVMDIKVKHIKLNITSSYMPFFIKESS